MTDAEIWQDFFDTFRVANALDAIVHVENFLAGRRGLLNLAPQAHSDPSQVLSCVKKIHDALGFRMFRDFVTLTDVAPTEGLDDVWSHWCPTPAELHKQNYPAGAIPLWSNGTNTVYCRIVQDSGNNEAAEFGIT